MSAPSNESAGLDAGRSGSGPLARKGLSRCVVCNFSISLGKPQVNFAHKTLHKYFFFYQRNSNSAHRPGPLRLLHIIKN